MSSPWAKISVPEPVNLQEIMSEQGARGLQDKRSQKIAEAVKQQVEAQQTNAEEHLLGHLQTAVEDTSDPHSDALIAQMLQEAFDEEYTSTENRRDSPKISVIFNNYQRIPQNIDFESDSEEEEEEINYDTPLDGRLNVCKFTSCPSECPVEDGARYDLQCSDKVFSSLKLHSKQERNRRHKIHNKKEEAISELDVDECTRLHLRKMFDKQLLKSVDSIITEGNESVILHAESNPSYPHATLPEECAVKVFKRTLAEFKRREEHIGDDYPFKVKVGKAKIRHTVHLWAEKEADNLKRLRNAEVPCPEVVDVRKHMVVMSFIGKNHIPAPKLKDAKLSPDDLVKAYNQIMHMMRSMFRVAKLVHSDLSENNILWHEGQCYFVGVSQSVELYHPEVFHLLLRDCENITRFFEERNTPKIKTAREVFHNITFCKFNCKKWLDVQHADFKGQRRSCRYWDFRKMGYSLLQPSKFKTGCPVGRRRINYYSLIHCNN